MKYTIGIVIYSKFVVISVCCKNEPHLVKRHSVSALMSRPRHTHSLCSWTGVLNNNLMTG